MNFPPDGGTGSFESQFRKYFNRIESVSYARSLRYFYSYLRRILHTTYLPGPDLHDCDLQKHRIASGNVSPANEGPNSFSNYQSFRFQSRLDGSMFLLRDSSLQHSGSRGKEMEWRAEIAARDGAYAFLLDGNSFSFELCITVQQFSKSSK